GERGPVLFALGRDRDAAEEFRAVMHLRPEHARGGLHRAWALERLQEWEGAEAAARAVLARRPDDPLAVDTLARVLRRQRRADEAAEALREASAPAPGATTLTLGRALLDAGRFEEAAAAFRAALHIAPTDARAHMGLAVA